MLVYMNPDWVIFQNILNLFLLETLYLFTWFRNEMHVTHSGVSSFRFPFRINFHFIPKWKTIARKNSGNWLTSFINCSVPIRRCLWPSSALSLIIFPPTLHSKPFFRWRIVGLLANACLVLYCIKYRCFFRFVDVYSSTN